MTQATYPLQVHCNGKDGVGSCQAEFYTTTGAALKGVTMFLLVFFAAALSIVLPGLHYVTVPLGILASPIVGIYFFVTRRGALKAMTGEFHCPECQTERHVAFRGGRPPYFAKCDQCQHTISISPSL